MWEGQINSVLKLNHLCYLAGLSPYYQAPENQLENRLKALFLLINRVNGMKIIVMIMYRLLVITCSDF